MSRYLFLHSPLNLIDGIPASIAGEWPGIKSNKFARTKKIIHIKNSNIFSLDDSFPNHSRKKKIIPNIKEEFPIRPIKRRVASATTIKLKSKTLYNDILPTPIQNYNRLVINRVYDFERRAKYYKMIQDNYDKKMKENEIINKAKNNNMGLSINSNNPVKGFNRKFFENVSNNKILKVTLTKDLYHKYKNKIEKMKKFNSDFRNANKKRKINSYKDLSSKKKLLEMMKQQEKLKHDIDYVTSLDQIK